MNRLSNAIPYRYDQLGLTLVEILVALAISLVLIGGIIQIFIGNKLTYRVQDNLSRIQENGRYAMQALNQDIRMANYRGCAGSKPATAINLLNNSSDMRWNFLSSIPVEGFDNPSSSWPTALSNAGLSASAVSAGTDVIIVRGPDTTNSGFIISQASTTGNLQIRQPSTLNLQTNDIVMVADCSDVVAFQVTGVTPINAGDTSQITVSHAANVSAATPGNAKNNLNKIFANAEVTRLTSKIYYIGTGASGQPALFRMIPPNAGQELVEGIENMQIIFGVDNPGACGGVGISNDGAIDCYLRANQITAAVSPFIRSTQIALLSRSLDNNLTPTPQSISYNSGTVNSGTGADRRLRQLFTATVALRNQLR